MNYISPVTLYILFFWKIRILSSFLGGYLRKILTVDLKEKTFKVRRLKRSMEDLFFGGRGLGIAMLMQHFTGLQNEGKYKNAFREVDPLSEDNALIFSTSPTTGTKVPTSGRFHVNFKSPMTEGVGSANSGGKWAVAFKKTGHDVLIVRGKSSTPVYLDICSKGVTFANAESLLDLNVEEITDLLLKKSSEGTRVMTIGEAGRKMVRMAAIINDRGRALGRGGGGAVFGSKNLLGIVAVPDAKQLVEVADPKALSRSNMAGVGYKSKMKLELGKMTRKEKSYGILPSMGTLGILGMVNNYNELVHNNVRDTKHRIEDIERINGEALRSHSMKNVSGEKRIESRKGACYNCPIACTRITKIRDERGNIVDSGEGPEFETVALMGANLSIYDLVTVTEANYLANRYGLDTISLGSTIASFFDLYDLVKNKKDEKTKEEKMFIDDTREFVKQYGEPAFGRKEILVPLVHAIAGKKGIGKELSQGSFRFCEKYGHKELSMSVKKLEMPAYDPRAAFLQGLCYEMNNRGACHLENGYTAIRDYCAGYAEWPGDRIEGTAVIARNAALHNTAIDILGVCAFASLSLSLDEFASLVNAVTGLNYNAGSLEIIAWRTLTLERMFNIQAGFTRDDDWLPSRFYSEKLDMEGRSIVCSKEAFCQMHQEYYEAMGWDRDGVPEKNTIETLGLSDYTGQDSLQRI
ncbi:MAG: aldehyde ferredoxin oxidoreductase C-terminal domain-containing protein [Chitinispirillia bacterium]